MLEFEASYLPFKSLFKIFASDMTIYNSLPPYRVISWNSISALNSWTQNCLVLRFRRLPEQTRMQKYIYGSFANFNPRAIVNTSCRRNTALMQKHYGACSWIFRAFSYQMHTDERNLSLATLTYHIFPSNFWNLSIFTRSKCLCSNVDGSKYIYEVT